MGCFKAFLIISDSAVGPICAINMSKIYTQSTAIYFLADSPIFVITPVFNFNYFKLIDGLFRNDFFDTFRLNVRAN